MRVIAIIIGLAVLCIAIWPAIRTGMKATKKTADKINEDGDPPPPPAI